MKFEIFAGLGGGFNSEESKGIEEFESEELALDAAYELACDEYDNMAGSNGLNDFDVILSDIANEEEYEGVDDDELEAIAWEMYNEEREGWVVFHVVEITE